MIKIDIIELVYYKILNPAFLLNIRSDVSKMLVISFKSFFCNTKPFISSIGLFIAYDD